MKKLLIILLILPLFAQAQQIWGRTAEYRFSPGEEPEWLKEQMKADSLPVPHKPTLLDYSRLAAVDNPMIVTAELRHIDTGTWTFTEAPKPIKPIATITDNGARVSFFGKNAAVMEWKPGNLILKPGQRAYIVVIELEQ